MASKPSFAEGQAGSTGLGAASAGSLSKQLYEALIEFLLKEVTRLIGDNLRRIVDPSGPLALWVLGKYSLRPTSKACCLRRSERDVSLISQPLS